ncbi:MAG: AAA family ATPase [Zoogloeaceae bacterium]|nr:AAA family ATPase [Zoogloeaceae bacterium]
MSVWDIDLATARRFFDLMAEGEAVTFQTFDDSGAKRPELASICHGDIDQRAGYLAGMNARGAGVYWMVNFGDGKGRSGANVTGIRCLFLDLDGAPLGPVLDAGVEPHCIIESSPGRWHVYWQVTGCAMRQFKPAQQALAAKFRGDRSITDPPRVMRVPGFLHRKGEPFLSRIESLEAFQPYDFDDLIRRLGLTLRPDTPDIDPDTGEIYSSGGPINSVGTIAEGGRHNYLTRWAGKLNSLGMHPDAVRRAVEAENRAACDPPLPDAELRSLVEDVLRRYSEQRGQDPLVRMDRQGRPQAFTLLTLAELEAASANVSWLVKGIVPADSLGVIFGGSGTFKSFIALDFSLHVAHRMPWLGRKTRGGPVIYIAAEGGTGLARRIKAWHKSRKLDPASAEMRVLPIAVDMLADADAVMASVMALRIVPALVIVDTMSQTFSGEENSAQEVGNYLRTLQGNFRAVWHCAVGVVHHSGHQATERPRGSSAIRANTDWMFGVFRDEQQMLATVECHKQKDGENFEPLTFGLDAVELGFDEDGDPVSSLVAKYLQGDEESARKASESSKEVRGHLGSLFQMTSLGMSVQALRMAFYDYLPANKSADDKGRTFRRALKEAQERGLIECGKDPKTHALVITYVNNQW